MKIYGPGLKNYLNSLKPNFPALKKTALEFLPWGLAAGSVALAGHSFYDNIPAFQKMVDSTREFLQLNQTVYEVSASAVALGTIPDLMAQRYEILSGQSSKINWGRLALMSAVGGISGGVIIRQMFNINTELFPGKNFSQVLKKVLFDQFVFAPVYLGAFFCGMEVLKEKSLKAIPKGIKKWAEIMPVNWVVWLGCFSWIIYFSPKDTMVYVQDILAIIWRAFIYHKSAMEDNTQKPEKKKLNK